MNELKFNSAICTSIKQSQRLLKLGLKPETADMYHTTFYRDNVGYEIIQVRNEKLPLLSQETPAWSLHRLMEMLEIYLDYSPFTGFNDIGNVSIYDDLIDLVENMISKDMFYKEYLKQ